MTPQEPYREDVLRALRYYRVVRDCCDVVLNPSDDRLETRRRFDDALGAAMQREGVSREEFDALCERSSELGSERRGVYASVRRDGRRVHRNRYCPIRREGSARELNAIAHRLYREANSLAWAPRHMHFTTPDLLRRYLKRARAVAQGLEHYLAAPPVDVAELIAGD